MIKQRGKTVWFGLGRRELTRVARRVPASRPRTACLSQVRKRSLGPLENSTTATRVMTPQLDSAPDCSGSGSRALDCPPSALQCKARSPGWGACSSSGLAGPTLLYGLRIPGSRGRFCARGTGATQVTAAHAELKSNERGSAL